MQQRGLIIVYIGDGKGKTTAAVGLAIRAAGAGKKVLFCQFVKAAHATDSGEWPLSSEIRVLEKTSHIQVKVLGKGFVGILGDKKAHTEHQKAAQEGLLWLKKEIESGKYEVVVADELISAIELGLVGVDQVLDLFSSGRAYLSALVITGHKKYNKLVNQADLVTQMKMLKHPYYQGRLAERGIDF